MTIIIENNENIRTIILNRTEKLNSVNLKMATELNQAVNNAAKDKSVQCLVITGNGRAFSSGGDVNEMGEHLPKAGDLFYDLTEQIHSIFSTILRMEKPVINSLNGVVAGGSLGFADPDNKVSLGFIMNQMHPGITAWKTATDVADSVYSNL